MPRETEIRTDQAFAAESPKVQDALEKLSVLAAKKGNLLIEDLAREIEKFEDEPAEAVWEGLNARGIEIADIDKSPEKRKPNKTNGKKEDENELLPDVVGAMFKQVEGIPLLTHRQEIEAFIKIRRGERASKEIRKIVNTNRAPKRVKHLSELVSEGKEASDLMVLSNRRLAFMVANKRNFILEQMNLGTIGTVQREDLINEGNIGLLRVIKKFRWQSGNKFSTYATWWARQATTRGADLSARTIRLPSHFIEELSKYQKTVGTLWQTLKRKPTDEEIIKAGIPAKRLKYIKEHKLTVSSLSEPTGTDDEEMDEMGDLIPDEKDPYQEIIDGAGMKEAAQEILSSLTRRERIIAKFMGEERTYQFVGNKLGLTRERVRQIWEKIKEKTESNFAEKKKELFGPED